MTKEPGDAAPQGTSTATDDTPPHRHLSRTTITAKRREMATRLTGDKPNA